MKTALFTALSIGAIIATAAGAQTATPVTEAFTPGAYTSTDGEVLYRTFCAGCHMPDGGGAIGAGAYPALRENPNLEFASYAAYIIINGQAAMPALGELLDDEQIVALTTFLQTSLGNDYEPDATVEMIAETRPLSTEPELAEHEVADTEINANRAAAATGEVAADVASGADAETGAETDAAASGGAAGVVRHPIPGSDFPILQAVEVPADATLVYLSGTVPQVIDETAAEDAQARFGDTAAQTESTLASIEEKLAALDLTMGDVIKMQAYLVAPDGSDAMDFAGFMEGYVRYFGTEEQPNLPTRSVFAVAGLANPLWLVEIEVVAVRE